jgi:hypothetical protein
MIITLVLSAEDYLTYHLYTASKSKRIKNKRYKSWLITTVIFFLFSYLLKDTNEFLTYYFLVAGVLSLVFFPLYQRYRYKKFYWKFVNEKLQYKFDKECVIDFRQDAIGFKDATGEGKINTTEISGISEISTHYFIEFKAGESLIVPKKLINGNSFLPELIALFQNPNIIVNNQLSWKWK